MIKFVDPWDGQVSEAKLRIDKYHCNGRMAVLLDVYDNEFGYWSQYWDITTNIPEAKITNENCGFLHTNNAPWLAEFVIKNGIGVPTGRVGYSGYCMYPEFDFTKLVEMKK